MSGKPPAVPQPQPLNPTPIPTLGTGGPPSAITSQATTGPKGVAPKWPKRWLGFIRAAETAFVGSFVISAVTITDFEVSALLLLVGCMVGVTSIWAESKVHPKSKTISTAALVTFFAIVAVQVHVHTQTYNAAPIQSSEYSSDSNPDCSKSGASQTFGKVDLEDGQGTGMLIVGNPSLCIGTLTTRNIIGNSVVEIPVSPKNLSKSFSQRAPSMNASQNGQSQTPSPPQSQ